MWVTWCSRPTGSVDVARHLPALGGRTAYRMPSVDPCLGTVPTLELCASLHRLAVTAGPAWAAHVLGGGSAGRSGRGWVPLADLRHRRPAGRGHRQRCLPGRRGRPACASTTLNAAVAAVSTPCIPVTPAAPIPTPTCATRYRRSWCQPRFSSWTPVETDTAPPRAGSRPTPARGRLEHARGMLRPHPRGAAPGSPGWPAPARPWCQRARVAVRSVTSRGPVKRLIPDRSTRRHRPQPDAAQPRSKRVHIGRPHGPRCRSPTRRVRLFASGFDETAWPERPTRGPTPGCPFDRAASTRTRPGRHAGAAPA